MVGQQRQQISELQFDQFPTPSTFSCWKIRFKTQASSCSSLTRRQCYGSKKWRWSEVFAVSFWTNFPNFEMLDVKIASALNKIIHNSHFKKTVSLEEQNAKKRGPVSTRNTDRLPDLRVLSGHWSQRFCRELCRPIYDCSSK